VAARADRDFVVVWESWGSSGSDTTPSIQGQRYASGGTAQGAEFQVNSYETSGQFFPAVAAGSAGDFVVVWHSEFSSGTDPLFSVQGQRYTSSGSSQGAQFQVNTYTTNGQGRASAAAESNGDFVVAWISAGSPGTDTSGYSIQGQRYSVPAPPEPLPVPAMSPAARFGLAAALLLLSATYALRRCA
jgi:hypothetical protein